MVDGALQSALQIGLGFRHDAPLLEGRLAKKLKMVDGVCPDGHPVRLGQLDQLIRGQHACIGWPARWYRPAFGDLLQNSSDLGSGKWKQVPADRTQVPPVADGPEGQTDVPSWKRQIESGDGRWSATHDGSKAVPPHAIGLVDHAARDEDDEGDALGGGDGERIPKVVRISIIEGHDETALRRRR